MELSREFESSFYESKSQWFFGSLSPRDFVLEYSGPNFPGDAAMPSWLPLRFPSWIINQDQDDQGKVRAKVHRISEHAPGITRSAKDFAWKLYASIQFPTFGNSIEIKCAGLIVFLHLIDLFAFCSILALGTYGSDVTNPYDASVGYITGTGKNGWSGWGSECSQGTFPARQAKASGFVSAGRDLYPALAWL